MSTKTIGVVGRGSGLQKVGIELGSYVFNPNSSQPGMFQTFALNYKYYFTLSGEKNRAYYTFLAQFWQFGNF